MTTSLQKAIAHYKRIAKIERGNTAHYALGALDILDRVKALRDGIREEMKAGYRHRAEQGSSYWYDRDIVRNLDSLMEEPSGLTTASEGGVNRTLCVAGDSQGVSRLKGNSLSHSDFQCQ